MKITRHNYEEYFILYMDNELGSEDRRMVEAFIKQNPDLKDELDNLLQYKLEPDTSVTFSGKEELLKVNGEAPISLSNYEEWLVLYTDNELTPAQEIAVEKFVAANPIAKKELGLLQKTKLQPETILFAHKQSLYRKEEKVRAMPFRWWRAAAAVLLFAIGLATVIIINRKPSGTKEDIIAKDTPKEIPAGTNEIKTPGNPVAVVKEESNRVINPSVSNNELQKAANASYKEIALSPVQKNNKIEPEKILPVNTPAPIKNEIAVVQDNNKPTNNLPQPLNNPNSNNNKAPKDAIANNNLPADANNPQNALTKDVVTTGNPQPSDIVQAKFIDDDGSGKKNKLRGFFRKVTRTFEKRTNIDPTDGEDRLLVAGLSIKMK